MTTVEMLMLTHNLTIPVLVAPNLSLPLTPQQQCSNANLILTLILTLTQDWKFQEGVWSDPNITYSSIIEA